MFTLNTTTNLSNFIGIIQLGWKRYSFKNNAVTNMAYSRAVTPTRQFNEDRQFHPHLKHKPQPSSEKALAINKSGRFSIRRSKMFPFNIVGEAVPHLVFMAKMYVMFRRWSSPKQCVSCGVRPTEMMSTTRGSTT